MATVTLATLRSRARSRADMVTNSFISDPELDNWLNEGCAAIHAKLVSAYAESYAFDTEPTVIPDFGSVGLPTDFFKLYGIDITLNGKTRTLRPLMMNERNLWRNKVWNNGELPRYWLVSAAIAFYPQPPENTPVEIFYAPEFQAMTAPTDTVKFPNGWEKYAVAYAAMQMLMKEESDTSELQRVLAQMDQELEQIKENRDAAFPRQSIDAESLDYEGDGPGWW